MPLSILTICINTHTSAHTHRHTHTPGFPSLLQCYPQLQAQGWKEYQPPRAEKRGDVHIWHIHLGNYSLWLGEKRNLLGSQKKSSIPMFKNKNTFFKSIPEIHNSWQMEVTLISMHVSGASTRKQQSPELPSYLGMSRYLPHLAISPP